MIKCTNDNISKYSYLNTSQNNKIWKKNVSSREESKNIKYNNYLKIDNKSISKLVPKIKNLHIECQILKDLNNKEENEIPEIIKGVYTNDFNILHIHEMLIKRFKILKNKKIKELTEKRNIEIENLPKCKNMVDKKYHQSIIDEYNIEINNNINDFYLNEYLNSSYDIIEKYKNIGVLKRKYTFDKNSNDVLESSEQSKLRHQLIYQYLNIINEYIQVDVYRQVDEYIPCENCNSNLDSNNNSIIICNNCGYENDIPIIYEVKSHSNIFNKYEDRDNFYKRILIFGGKLSVKLPDDLFTKLDKHFFENGLPTSDIIRSLPLVDGKKPNTSKELLHHALLSIKHSDCYKYDNLICHQYWGWELPNISHLEDILMRDYDLTEKIISQIITGKKSRINRDFRLYQLLNKNNYPCNSSDFRIIKTPDILEYYYNIWSQVCDKLGGISNGWKLYPVNS